VSTLSYDGLVAALRAGAEGSYSAEAAVELLIAHGSWLRRSDFLRGAIEVTPAVAHTGQRHAFVDWHAGLAADLPASSSERQILAVAAELAGVDSHRTLGDLVTGLDDTNITLVICAVLHARSGRGAIRLVLAPFGGADFDLRLTQRTGPWIGESLEPPGMQQ